MPAISYFCGLTQILGRKSARTDYANQKYLPKAFAALIICPKPSVVEHPASKVITAPATSVAFNRFLGCCSLQNQLLAYTKVKGRE